jgi:hypothetical protein
MDNVDIVKQYLRGQNLEQVGRVEEAADLYEIAIRAHFDSTGPYDRLIAIYSNRAEHRDVVRVASAALEHVHTHEEKRSWYEQMRVEAERAAERVPKAAPKDPTE